MDTPAHSWLSVWPYLNSAPLWGDLVPFMVENEIPPFRSQPLWLIRVCVNAGCECRPCISSPFDFDTVTQTLSQKVFWSFFWKRSLASQVSLGESVNSVTRWYKSVVFPFDLSEITSGGQRLWYGHSVIYSVFWKICWLNLKQRLVNPCLLVFYCHL